MRKKTLELLEGSGVNGKTHPVLVSLLEMAAQPAGVGGNGALKTKQARAWHKVAAAFRRCVAAGVTDAMLRQAMPFHGVEFTDEAGWRITAVPPLSYREDIAAALDKTASQSGALLQRFEIRTLEDLRRAQRQNCLPGPEAVLHGAGKLEGRLLEGRRCVVSWNIWGVRLFGLLESDEFGHLRPLGFRESKRAAMKLHAQTPVAP